MNSSGASRERYESGGRKDQGEQPLDSFGALNEPRIICLSFYVSFSILTNSVLDRVQSYVADRSGHCLSVGTERRIRMETLNHLSF